MSVLNRSIIILALLLFQINGYTQNFVKGKVIDAITSQPIEGASIKCMDDDCHVACASGISGEFEMNCTSCTNFHVSFIGYQSINIPVSETAVIMLSPTSILMNEIVLTANRGEATKRSMAPVAVAGITSKVMQDTRAISADQLLNKISGVNVVNLGNEQHQMSIRQPITTKSLFLYLEDGIPVRTTGIFNHNALLEMNMAATKAIEVIKGPSSSLYGSEAIGGVVNFITLSPSQNPFFRVSAQANTNGYKRTEIQSSFTKNKLGFVFSGYYADKKNGFMEYSDFHKSALTARMDFSLNDKSKITASATRVGYYSDMPGSIDSTMFATRKYSNPQTFTYRKVNAFRFKSGFYHTWNNENKSQVTLVYRDNSIEQNPAYRIKDDYRLINGTRTGNKELAHGEINKNGFHSYAIITQHKKDFTWKNASITAGANMDLSPSSYTARYIRIQKDTVTKKYNSYTSGDSLLTNYNARINNYAAFANFEFSPVEKMRFVASLRYDIFRYHFNNHLSTSSFSGSNDTTNIFKKLSTKLGFTYNFSKATGIYANYSQGFVPPQLTEMYTGVKVPSLSPAVFYNYEIGGWTSLIKGRLRLDASIYTLTGTNELVSVKLDDGSTENRNAGKTNHKGIEMGLNLFPAKDLSIRFSGAYSEHRFINFIEKGNNYNGKEMNGAPRWINNAEVWYKPSYIKGLRIGMEWQKTGSYFMDPANTAKYYGYNVLHFRSGFRVNAMDVWFNILNLTDNYYSNLTVKTSSSQTYQLADPRSFHLGCSFDLAGLLKK